jgi:hypothetical protein
VRRGVSHEIHQEVNMKKMNKFTFRTLVLLGGVLALASGLASAQSGTFRLPVEAHWERAVLPAGEYSYSVDQRGGKLVTIRSLENGSGIMVMAASYSMTRPLKNQLILTKSGNQMFVTSLSLEDSGMVLNYTIPKTKNLVSTASLPERRQATLVSASK